jgi:hypothetical protein
MQYDVRDATGTLIITLSNQIAQELIQQSPGQFRPWRRNPEVTVFEFTQDMIYKIPGIAFHIWSGTLLIPRD